MQKRKNSKAFLMVIVVLMLLALFTFVIASGMLVKIKGNIPEVEIALNKANENPVLVEEQSSVEDVLEEEGAKEKEDKFVAEPGLDVYDFEQSWIQETEVEIFKASYENVNGEITVKSDSEAKVIAPGTSNQYDFYVKNTGNIPIHYRMTTEAVISARIGEETYEIPLEARFYNQAGKNFVGSENKWSNMLELDGICDEQGLSVGHYNKYTLEWQWPFEGNDEYDTLLGDLAADGNTLRVAVKIKIAATDDLNASGGVETGDIANVGIWTALCVCSVFLIVLLLFDRRKDENEI